MKAVAERTRIEFKAVPRERPGSQGLLLALSAVGLSPAVQLSLPDQELRLGRLRRQRLADGRGRPVEHVRFLLGQTRQGGRDLAAVIQVNCGVTPPLFALTLSDGAGRQVVSRRFAITHEVQERILAFLDRLPIAETLPRTAEGERRTEVPLAAAEAAAR